MLGRELEDAFRYACILHADQTRKGTSTPYVAHLMAVTALVLEDGGGEDEAIAALLHDAVEDRGGRARLEDIERRFGPSVAQMVLDCSDWAGRPGQPKDPWWERKQAYIAHLPDASPGGLRVSLADKVANARSIVRDARLAREQGDEDGFWTRFSTRAAGQLWYFRSLLAAFREAVDFPTALLGELELLVAALEEAVPAEAHAAQTGLPPSA